MGGQKQGDSKKGKPSGAGRRKGKFDGMFARTAEHKLRNVLKRNGAVEAAHYVKRNRSGLAAVILKSIAKEGTFAGGVAREVLGR
jgi:hypothetical protein